MTEHIDSILANVLVKRIHDLGYDSLRKFYMANREAIGVSYELFRQVMNSGRVPRVESLVPILQAAQVPPSAIRNLLSRLYPHLNGDSRRDHGSLPGDIASEGGRNPEIREEGPAATDEIAPGWGPGLQSSVEIARKLSAALCRVPIKGNEDLWEMADRLTEIAEKKVRNRSRGRIDQPFLFGKEPEAIYQFQVRRGKAVPFMSKGEECPLDFKREIDYPDRYRGALLGQAIGAALGRVTQGLSGGDIRALYGRIESPADNRSAGGPRPPAIPFNGGLSSLLSKNPLMDPDPVALSIASEIARQDATEGEILFSSNLREREFPWFEAGEPIPESAAAARCIPFALLHAGDFRRLKLESCICAAITHPHPASIAGAALLSISIARLLHTLPGNLDPIQFARSSAPFIAGIETDRSGGRSRTVPSLARKIGTELPALLLRRASIEEIAKTVGNGESPSEGIPFAFGCVLSNPADFGEAVLSAINSGNDAIRIGAMAGALSGALLGESSIPVGWLERLDGKQSLEDAAASLLGFANPPTSGIT